MGLAAVQHFPFLLTGKYVSSLQKTDYNGHCQKNLDQLLGLPAKQYLW